MENMLLGMIIRPPRFEYEDDSDQNNSIHEEGGKKFVKKVFSI